MAILLPDSFLDEIERPHGEHEIVWLIELELSRPYKSGPTVVPSTVLRVSSYHERLAWPAASLGGETWDPYNFDFSPITQTQEGDLPQVDLSVDNSARLLMRYLHAGDGMEGNYCTVFMVPENGLAIPSPDHEYQRLDLTVAGAFANDEQVTFRLEKANFFTRQAPQDRFIAGRCRWGYGSDECGYVINAVAAYPTCPKTLQACVDRGSDHAARGLPVLHPRRFGGFPGIPRQR